ncbi:MAG TPA: cysteine desulfurase NifS [Thermoplasmatales archaeon]|nr:cysteine desulfurase NifS [Thermoplasmatales archaeon]
MKVYLDHAATTPVAREVLEAMIPFFSEKFGNASSLHAYGREARKALEESREKVAKLINAEPEEIIFTGSGTESDNLAIKGIAFLHRKGHIITSSIEHPAVLETCHYLQRKGFEVTFLPVDKYGLIDIDELEKAIREDTILISIMHASNEIGTIEPVEEIGKIASKNNIIFHTDAVQSVGKIEVDVKKLNVDLLSMSSHKIHGPKGVGALYIRKGIKIEPVLHGGGHERGLRSSTENVAGIVGFAKACEIAGNRMEKDAEKMTKLRDKIIKEVLKIEETYLTGHPTKRLPNHASFYFRGIEGESLVLMLDSKGIATSTGSACSSKKLQPSHVLLATGVKPEDAHGSLRVTLGRENTEEEIEYFLDVLPQIVEDLRKISPMWHKSK